MSDTISWPAGFRIAPRKVTHYLLDPHSRDGRAKAAFFTGVGFRREDPDRLSQALFRHTDLANFVGITVVPRGHKLIFEGPMEGPGGRTFRLRSVWQVDAGGDGLARFVTAYAI